MAVCQSGQPIPDSTFCRRFMELVRMMACVVCVSCWEASHCIAFVAASTSMVRLEDVTLWVPLPLCKVLPPSLTVNPQPDWSPVTEPFRWITMSCGLHLVSTSICTSALVFPVGHSQQCMPRFSDSSLVVGLELNWTFFPVPYLLELCKTAHMLD